jgi:hypothetical protein
MFGNRDKYLREAERARHSAADAQMPEAKEFFFELESSYLRLAEQVERIERVLNDVRRRDS